MTNQIFSTTPVCTQDTAFPLGIEDRRRKQKGGSYFTLKASWQTKRVNTSVLGENSNTKLLDACFDLRQTIPLHGISRNKPNILSTVQSLSSWLVTVSNSIPYAEYLKPSIFRSKGFGNNGTLQCQHRHIYSSSITTPEFKQKFKILCFELFFALIEAQYVFS